MSSEMDKTLFGTDLFGESMKPKASGALAERFLVPPFSVLDARQGYWKERKAAWESIGIRGREGRGKELNPHGNPRPEWERDYEGGETAWGGADTSVFDPVLCELIVRWFCPKGGSVFDPFAGEATKGIVTEFLGRRYTGIELRPEQIEANRQQAKEIGVCPKWIQGDSARIPDLVEPNSRFDLVFTSPPYFDLEIYSKRATDGSALPTYERFMAWYEGIFRQSLAVLKKNRFLVVKIGEVRAPDGVYRNFVGDNIQCFNRLGMSYYNEAILVTPVGSLPVRAGKQFKSGRKLAKGHQNVLCFFNGKPSVETIRREFHEDVD